MALIKKYNRGGSFADYVKNKAAKGELPLTNKSWTAVQEGLSSFNVDTPASGNVKKNWAGQYVADTPESVNNFLANLYTEYQQNAPKQVSITPEGGWGPADRTVGDLMSHIAKTKYHGNEDYAVQEIGKMTNNNDIKRYLVNEMNNLFTDYETHASSDTTGDNWKDLSKIRELRNIFSNINTANDISDDDWAKIGSYLQNSGFDWNLNDYLITDDELKRREEQATADEAQKKKDASLSSFESLGISNPELRESLYNAGYTKRADNFSPDLSEYFKNNGYNVFSDESGKNYRVFKGNDLVNGVSGLMSEDQFSPDYGKTFSIQNGQIIFHDRGQLPEGLELPEWTDEGNLRRRLIPLSGTALPNLYDYENSEWKGWKIFGDSNEKAGVPAKDILGRRDYTASITLISPDNQQTIKAFKEADGSYITEDGRKLPKFTFSGFGESEEILPIHSESLYNSTAYNHLGWGNIEANDPNDWWERAWRWDKNGLSYKIDTNYLEDQLLKYEAEIANADYQNRKVQNVKPGQVKTLLERAKWFYNNGTKEEREWATANFIRINNILDKEDTKGNKLFIFEQGGILKAQDGSSLKAAVEANKKYVKPSNSETGSTSEDRKGITGIDLQTAWKNASGLQKASTFASIASMVPVLGVAGGAVSTVLDAVDGAQDGRFDKSDWLNLAGNLGFTALSAVGLGATKSGKLIMQANRMAKLGKTAKTAGIAGKAGKAADITKDLTKAAERAKKWGANKNTVSILEDASKAVKSGEKIGDDVLKLADDFLKPNTTWVGAHTAGIGDAVKNAGKFVTEKAPLLGKAAKIGLIGQAGYTGALGATDLVGNMISEGSIKEGFMNTDINSIRQTAQLAFLGKRAYKNRKYSKAAEKYIKMEGATPDKTIVTVGDKKITVDGELLKKYNTNIKNTIKGPFKPSIKEADKKSFLEGLKGKVSKQDQETIEALLNQEGKIGKIEFNPIKSSGGNPVLAREPESFSYKDRKQYKTAKKIYEQGKTRYGQVSRKKQPITYETSAAEATAKPVTKPVTKPTATTTAKPTATTTATTKPTAKDMGIRAANVKKAVNREVDLAKLFRGNKTVRDAIKKHYGPNVKTKDLGVIKPNQLNMKHDKTGLYQVLKNRNLSKKQQGGVLKMKWGDTFPSLYAENPTTPKFDLSNLRFTSPYSTSQTGFTYSDPGTQRAHQAFLSIYPQFSKANQSFGTSFLPHSSSSSSSDIPDGAINEFEVELFKKKPYRNYSFLTEAGKLALSRQTNAKSTAEQIKAAAQVPYMSTIQAPHLRTSTPFTALHEKEAGNLQSSGERIANSTADWDKGVAVRLGAAKQASDLRLQGQYQDITRNDAIVSQQNQLNNKMLEYNTNIMNQNAARGADARSKIHQLLANRIFIDGTGTQNFLSFLGKEAAQAPMKRSLWELYQETSNPNITRAYDHAEYLNNEGQKVFKDRWQASEDARKGQPYYTPVKWEDSDEYKEWEKVRSSHQNTINDLLANYQRAQRVASTMSYFQGGGKMTLEDRIVLENVKYNHKRLLKNEELYFKQLMNNSKLVQKALIKVFK